MNGSFLQRKILWKHYEKNCGTFGKNQLKTYYADDIGYAIPSGYVPIGMTHLSNDQFAGFYYLHLGVDSGSETRFVGLRDSRETGSSYATTILQFDVLFAPSWMVEDISANQTSVSSSNVLQEPIFKRAIFSGSYSGIKSNNSAILSQTDMSFFVPTGYKVFSIWYFTSGNSYLTVTSCDPLSTDKMMVARNVYSTSSGASGTIHVGFTFINNKYSE